MKNYKFSLQQQPRFFEVEAKSKEEAYKILESSNDITDYEFEDVEMWLPDFEFIGED